MITTVAALSLTTYHNVLSANGTLMGQPQKIRSLNSDTLIITFIAEDGVADHFTIPVSSAVLVLS